MERQKLYELMLKKGPRRYPLDAVKFDDQEGETEMTYFVLGYVANGYDPKRAPRPEVLIGNSFATEAEARAYAATVHESYRPFVAAIVEGDWAERIAAEYDKAQQLQEE